MLAAVLFLIAEATAAPTGPTPIGDPTSWITNDDYPAEALRSQTEGTVEFDISVDTTGHAARCNVILSSGADLLDKTACAAVARRGSWKPTVDDTGQPMFAIYHRRVRWRLPDQSAPPPLKSAPDMEVDVAKLPVPSDQAVVVVRQVQRPDGTEESCVVVTPSPSPALNRLACAFAAPLTKVDPIGNTAGEFVRGARWRTIQFLEKRAETVAK